MNPIDKLFQDLRKQGRRAFMPFVSAGDPDLDTTIRLVDELGRHGASLIEVGLPYSDPIADGPVIQASYTRALANGFTLDDCFARFEQRTTNPKVPLVVMTAFALVYRRNPDQFLKAAQVAGFSGAIVPDLPIEEAEDLSRLARARDFKLIHLVTPTTPRERAARIARASTGFLYYVSVTGITGARRELPSSLLEQLRWLRSQTDVPICVGFGISNSEQVAMLREVADGIIVGSALVRQFERFSTESPNQVIAEIAGLAQSLANALNP